MQKQLKNKEYYGLCAINLISSSNNTAFIDTEGVDDFGEEQFQTVLYKSLGLQQHLDQIILLDREPYSDFSLGLYASEILNDEELASLTLADAEPLTLACIQSTIELRQDSCYQMDGVSWLPDVLGTTYLLLIISESPIKESTGIQLITDKDNDFLIAINNQVIGNEYLDENRELDNEVFMVQKVVSPIYKKVDNEDPECPYEYWNTDSFGTLYDKAIEMYGEGNDLTDYPIESGLNALKWMIETKRFKKIYVSINESKQYPVGSLVLTPDSAVLSLLHYENTFSDHGHMSTSAHSFIGQEINKLFPDIKVQGGLADGGMVVTGLCINEDPTVDSGVFVPAILNGFAELVKHWGLPGEEPDFESPDFYSEQPVFIKYADKLKNAGASMVIVDDFLEINADLTSVMIVSVYKGDSLLMECSYALLLGVKGRDEELKEIQMDKLIEEFCKTNNFAHRRCEHIVNHPFKSRHVSNYQSDKALAPSQPTDVIVNSSFVLLGQVSLDRPIDLNALKRKDHIQLYSYLSKLLKDNVRPANKSYPDPFAFALVALSDSNFDYEEILELLSPFTMEIGMITKSLELTPKIRCYSNNKLTTFYVLGIHDLEGKSRVETDGMMRNMTVRHSRQTSRNYDFHDSHSDLSIQGSSLKAIDFSYKYLK